MQTPAVTKWFWATLVTVCLGCTPAETPANGGGGAGAKASGGSGGASSGTGGNAGGASGGSPGNGASGGAAGSAAGSSGGSGGGGQAGAGGSSAGGTGGAAPGTGGNAAGGSPGQAGSAGSDAAGADVSEAGDGGLEPLTECTTPSLDRLVHWYATGEGNTRPGKEGESLLVKEGDRYVAKQEFLANGGGDPWHVLEIYATNEKDDGQVDLSKSAGFTMTYSSTSELFMQMRPGFNYSGGAQWATKIPSTGGQLKTTFFSFAPSSWSASPTGAPSWTYARALAAVRGTLLIGRELNVITIKSLRFDGYVPTCK